MRISEILEADQPASTSNLRQQTNGYTVDPRVKQLQQSLKSIGYNLGPPGVDGKYGPYTAAVVAAFRKDYGVPGNGASADGAVLSKLNSVTSGRTPRKTPSQTNQQSDVSGLPESGDLTQARKVVEQFHGSQLSDNEWNMLIRATLAESSPHDQERAAIMAVILNRVRSNRYPGSLHQVLHQKNQFQAVTGTPRDRTPSPHYTRTPSAATLSKLANAIVKYLPSASRSWLNFTSAVPAAYGAGTNIGFMHKVANSPGAKQIGKTWFGTV